MARPGGVDSTQSPVRCMLVEVIPTINVERLWSLVSEQTRLFYKDGTEGPYGTHLAVTHDLEFRFQIHIAGARLGRAIAGRAPLQA